MENTTMVTRKFTVGGEEIVKNVLGTVNSQIEEIRAEMMSEEMSETETDTSLAPVAKFTAPYIISDKALKKECNSIFNNITNIKTAMLEIGAALYRIKAKRLWKKDPATRDMQFHEFVSETFGITRATAYRWIENVSPYLNAEGQIVPEVNGMTVQQRTVLLNTSANGNGLSRKQLSELADKIDENPNMTENELKQAIADIKADKVDAIPIDCKEIQLFAPDMKVVVPKLAIVELAHPDDITTEKLYTRLLFIVANAYKSRDVNTGWSMVSYTFSHTWIYHSNNTKTDAMLYTVSAKHGKGAKEYHCTFIIDDDALKGCEMFMGTFSDIRAEDEDLDVDLDGELLDE